jgi:hypothetical protein
MRMIFLTHGISTIPDFKYDDYLLPFVKRSFTCKNNEDGKGE